MKKSILVKKNPRLIARMIENEFTILDPKTGALYQLNETASYIWKFLWKQRNYDEITNKLMARFEGDKKNVKKDVNDFIASSFKNGLLVRAK